MRKILSLIVCLVLMLTLAQETLATESNALVIVCESTTCTPGEQVTINVSITNNPGFAYLGMTPQYSSELTLTSATNGNLISDFTKGKQYVWVGNENVTANGTLMTLTFFVGENVVPGEYEVGFIVRTCANYDEQSVPVTVEKATIVVESNRIPVTGVSLDRNTLSLSTNESEVLLATVTPNDATDKNLIWESDNKTIAVVDENGLVTGIKEGMATITVRTSDGNFSAGCEVTVCCTHVNKSEHAAVNSTCQLHGNNLYYVCNGCERVFKADGITETSVENEKLPLAAHSFTDFDALGNSVCGICGRPELRVTRQPADYYGLTGDDAVFTAEANDAEAEYRWYYSNNDGRTWSPSGAEGHDTPSLTIRMIANRIGQLYRCVITTPGQRAETEAARLCLREPEPLSITRQPESFEGAENAAVTFSVEAAGEGLRYRWQYSNDGGTRWADSSADGNDTSELRTVLKKYRDGQCFRCIITDAAGNAVITNTVSMRIPEITVTLRPQDCTVPAGGTATFTVQAEGAEPVTYRWQYSNDGGRNWSDSGMTGAKTSSLSVAGHPYRDGQMYRCVIRDAYGTEAVTEAATLHVGGEEYAPVITAQPVNYTGAANGTAVFGVTANGEDLTYQWQYSNDGGEKWSPSGLDGAKTSSLRVEAKPYRNGQMYRCVVTNGYGSVVSEAAAIQIGG